MAIKDNLDRLSRNCVLEARRLFIPAIAAALLVAPSVADAANLKFKAEAVDKFVGFSGALVYPDPVVRVSTVATEGNFSFGVWHQDDGDAGKETSGDETDIFISGKFELGRESSMRVGAKYYDLRTLGKGDGDLADINLQLESSGSSVNPYLYAKYISRAEDGQKSGTWVGVGASANTDFGSMAADAMYDSGALNKDPGLLAKIRWKIETRLGLDISFAGSAPLVGAADRDPQISAGISTSF